MSQPAVARQRTARFTGVLATLTVVAIAASPAWAGALASATPSVEQGSTFTITGTVAVSPACPQTAPFQVTSTPDSSTANLFPNGLGPQVPRDTNGNFSVVVTVAATTPVGTYTIGFVCNTLPVGATETLNVVPAPQPKPNLFVAPKAVTAGATVTVTGVVPTAGTVSCPAGTDLQLTSSTALFPPSGLGPQAARASNDSFRASFTVASATASGTYSIGVRCAAGNTVLAESLQVTATAPTTTTTTTTATTTTTTTTIAPTTTTVTPGSTITIAPATTVPLGTATTTVPAVGATSSSKTSPLRWVAVGALVVVVLAGAALLFMRRRR